MTAFRGDSEHETEAGMQGRREEGQLQGKAGVMAGVAEVGKGEEQNRRYMEECKDQTR